MRTLPLLSLLYVLVSVTVYPQDIDELPFVLSTPEQVASSHLNGELLIDNKVSPLGSLSLSQTDLVIKGAQSISLTRFYATPALLESYGKENADLYHRYANSPLCGGWAIWEHTPLPSSP